MSLMISVEPELEAWLREEARRRGEPREELLSRDVAIRWASARNALRLTSDETELLQTINAGFPESFWSRYRELIALSDQAEEKTLQRTEAMIVLAQLRGVGLDELRRSLGILPISVVQ
nr:hypothetical protein [Armatimonas sp.]